MPPRHKSHESVQHALHLMFGHISVIIEDHLAVFLTAGNLQIRQCPGQDRLVFRQKNFCPVGQYKDILDPAGDVKLSAAVEKSDIARVQYAILQHSLCRLRIAVIALHHAGRRLHENLALSGNGHFILDTHLHRIRVAAHTDRHPGGCLRKAVAEAYADAFMLRHLDGFLRAAARTDQNRLQLFVEQIFLQQEFKKHRHQ